MGQQGTNYTTVGHQYGIFSAGDHFIEDLYSAFIQVLITFSSWYACVHIVIHPGLQGIRSDIIPTLHLPVAKVQLFETAICSEMIFKQETGQFAAALQRTSIYGKRFEIGRASCRERVEISVVA